LIILGKTKRFLLGVLASACLAAPATANPSGASVRHGQVTITPGVQTQIQQLTDQAIVDWNTFSIGSGESVRFLQPSDLSVILNRVTGVDPSIILGTLQANGNVFLINRNGILFGPDSVVNVGGLVASTLNLSNEDFLAGNYAFAQVPGSELAAVVNQGKITITPGGYAVLTGPSVINEGTIVAHAGKVVLASGEQATLNLDGRDLVHFSLSGQVSEGPVLLAPGMLSETIAATLGVAPSRQATQIVRGDDGSVRLVNSSGTLVHSGEIKVDAASGETAGSVLLDSSDLTLLTTDSVISASGVGQNSDGGEILVLSDMEGDPALGFTHVEAGALIAATGGETGDGGFIEVSGNRINLHGRHDLSAPGGKGGSFLLDPIFITVIDGDNAPTVVGDVTTIGDQWLTTDATGTSYTFTATRDILFDLGIAGNNPTGDGLIDFSAGGALALTIEAGTDAVELGSINLGDDGTTFRGLDFLNLVADGDILWGNSTVQVAGTILADAGGLLDLESSTIQATNRGDIDLSAGTRLEGGTAVVNPGAGVNTTGYLRLNSGGSIDLESGNFTVDGGEYRPFSVTAGTDLSLGSAVIDIFGQGTGGVGKGLVLTAGGDIDVGTVDLTFRDDINSSGSYSDLIRAGGRIFSSDTGGNSYSLNIISEAGLNIVASDGILLPELMLTVNHVHTGTAKRDVSFQAGNGDLDLRNSTVSVEGDVDFLTDQDLFLNNARIDTTRSGDVLLDAGGDVTLESASINASAAPNTTGFLHIDAGEAVTLGGSILKVDAAGEARPFTVTAGTDLNLGSALIDIVSDGTGGTKGLLLTAGGDIDLGAVDLTFRDDINSSGAYRDLIMAGGRIFSSDAGPYSLDLTSEAGLDIVASDGILLPELMLTVKHVHTDTKRDVSFQAGNGDLDLRNSTVSVEGDVDFLTDQDLFLNEARIDTTRSGDVLLDAGGDITLESASINASAASDTTGFLHIDAGGAVTLGGSILKVDAAGETRPFTVTAGTDLNLGSALIDIVSDGTGGAKGLLLTAGGDIDLGTVDLTFRDNINSSGSFFNQISAVGSISSTPGDGNPSNRPGRLDLVGPTQIQADTGDLEILDFDVVVNPEPGASTADLVVRAPNGAADFGESRFTVQNNLELVSDGNLDLSSSAVSAGNRLVVASNGGVSAILGGGVSVPDIQIFGYNTTTSMPDSTIATNGGVTLGLVTSGNTDLSIFATGDIDVTHTGGGSITAERLGLEGSGGTTSPSAIWSTGGDVSLVSDGTINLGKGAGDRGAAIIRSDAAADVTVQADQLVNSVTSGTSVIDAQSGGFVNIVGPTSAEALEVSAPGISVSLTDSPNSSSRVNIVGDSDFLKVAGNRSDIEVTELLSGNQLTMKQQTSDFVLTVDPLSVEGILYIDESDIALGDINTTADQTLAVRLGNTASISAAPTGFNLNIAGDLLLVAGGNIGTSSEPLTVPGGRTSIIAGGEVNIETAAADLTVAEVRQFDPFGNEVAFGEGFQSGGDLTIRMTGVDAALTQEEVIGSSSGNVAVEILDGDLVQSPGVANPAPVISGGTVALAVSGDVGTYDGTTATPIRINADSLVVDGGADVILEQPVGDLAIIEQATISGATYNTSGAVGDLRIQAGTGNLTVSTDLTVGGETALVTGADLDINPQFLPNSVFLNNSITSGQNLVILSNGDIVQNSGLLTAPAIGLGANGTVGAIGSPVNIQTNELALNPSTGHVFDSDGFTPVQSVSAVGVTVNQGAPPPPPPPPEPEPPVEPEVPVVPPTPPNEPTGPFIVDGNELIIPEFEVFESSFAQNNPDRVESYLDEVLTDLEYLELDPTKIPLGWYNDDDFLNKKFRR
jgi:filamentous hemagglutinin family protein